ncbi:hypothetical protein [Cryobacterium melibiosiphilum]|uniref:hypothetical protein n=1 Tax=Cryobacterium melibiosiphilum TaxID=995039 RepID=UPI0011C23223|nr:hypothetical protein [Cryobacterium melibiosiphilum]
MTAVIRHPRPTHCAGCGRRARGGKQLLKDHPGTVALTSSTECARCRYRQAHPARPVIAVIAGPKPKTLDERRADQRKGRKSSTDALAISYLLNPATPEEYAKVAPWTALFAKPGSDVAAMLGAA